MKWIYVMLLSFFFLGEVSAREFYQLKIYTLDNLEQEALMDAYLEDAFIPALHRSGIEHVGVFKEREPANELTQIFVLIPFTSITQFEHLEGLLLKDEAYMKAAEAYMLAPHKEPPFERIESILMRAFLTMPEYGVPTHASENTAQVYELRSYQGATEERYRKKVEMFDKGEEVKLFKDLDFQPIFFGEVISGKDMPNLMYLTTFKNEEAQKEHWDTFRKSPEWLELKADEQYKHTVSHIDKYMLYPCAYSDL